MFPNAQNPFKQTMVRMQLPPGSGSSISARGFELAADEDGCVEVPKELVPELECHGLRAYVAPADAAPKSKK